MNVEKRQEIERKVVRHLIRTMKAHGWIAEKVNDGEERVRCHTETEVIDNVFGVDESRVHFHNNATGDWCVVFIVLGNSGWDAICDYSYTPEFQKIMLEEIDPYCERLELECS